MTATLERMHPETSAVRTVVPGRVVRWRGLSLRVAPRAVSVSLVLAAAIVVVACWSISVGDFPIPVRDVVATLLGNGTPDTEFIVNTLRLPRVIVGVLVGAALAVAGGVFQSLARNPLASPDIIGFNSGAALGAVIVIFVVGGGSLAVSIGAVLGGLTTAVVVYALAWNGGVHGYRLVLVGIGIGFTAAAITDFLMTRAEIFEVQRAVVWLTGSLNGRSWDHVRPVTVGLVVLLPLTLVLLRRLRLLELGDDTASALGVDVGRTRLVLMVLAVCLAALATASAGPIGFVALVSAPIARRIVRSPGVTIVPTALVGALLVVTADLVARRVFAPTELPVGVATAVVGAPYLLWLLTREIRAGAM